MAGHVLAPLPDDMREAARITLEKCLRGAVDPRTAEVQRRTALDILSAGFLDHLTRAELEAEGTRIAEALDRLDARERAARK